jgi:WD40 repeat protein
LLVIIEYVIEYGEDVLMRDHVLASHRYISMVRHITDNKRFLVIPEDSDHIIVMDEEFRLISQLFPYKVQIVGGAMTKKQLEAANAAQAPGAGSRTVVYDITYLAGKEMYAFSASDHSITVCKEQISMGGKKVTYTLHNRIYHSLLHLKLCWSPRFKLLCSVASDRVIYGWDIDGPSPIFQISRHSDLITDFIAIDNLELFATCSMDHRIVLWSAQTRRVRVGMREL